MDKQIVINNLLVSYSEQGSGRPVIFLHGWRSQKEIWQPVIRQLVAANWQLFTIDLPGFGKSPFPKSSRSLDKLGTLQANNQAEGWSVGDYANVIKGFIEKLELKDVVIVGHSFGGRIGIKLAATNPQIISKLVLVDAAGFAMDGKKKNAFAFAAKLVKPFFKPKFMQGLRKRIYHIIGAEDYVATPELQKTFVNITAEDLTEDMKKVSCKTLIITGENDLDTPVEFGRRMNSLILNSQFVILKNAGHFSFLDKPEEFKKILNDFISSN